MQNYRWRRDLDPCVILGMPPLGKAGGEMEAFKILDAGAMQDNLEKDTEGHKETETRQ